MIISARPALARFPFQWPDLDAAGTLEERPFLRSVGGAYELVSTDPNAALTKFDGILEQVPQPGFVRGAVQMGRAAAFVKLDQEEESVSAVEEAIRLMPNVPHSKLLGAMIHLWADDPGRAADLFGTVTREYPEFARSTDPEFVNALRNRLRAVNDGARFYFLSGRLVEIDYPGSSDYVLDVMQYRIRRGDILGTQQLIPALVDPTDFGALLSDKKFALLWPNIEDWAGPRLERQWSIYLDAAERRWKDEESSKSGLNYALALLETRNWEAIIREFGPVAAKDAEIKESFDAASLAIMVAEAMISNGRTEDGFKLLAHLSELLPYTEDYKGLAVSTAWARLELETGQAESASLRIDNVIRAAKAQGYEDDQEVFLEMHVIRVCALFAQSRRREAVESIFLVTPHRVRHPHQYLDLVSCQRERKLAKSFLLQRLDDSTTYPFVLDVIQPVNDVPRSKFLIARRQFIDDLYKDPEIAAAIDLVGRKLSFPIRGRRPAS